MIFGLRVNMEVFLVLLATSIIAIITLLIIFRICKPLTPFRKMKDKNLDECYDMSLRKYKKK